MHGVTKTVQEVDQDGPAGKIFGQGKIGQKCRQEETKEKGECAERAQPRKGGCQRGKGGIGAETVGGARKKEKGQPEKGGHAENAVHENGESGAGFLKGKPAEKIEEPHGIASRGADQEKVEEKTGEGELKGPNIGERDFLEAKEKIKTRSAEKNGEQGNEQGGNQPEGVGGGEAVGEVGPVDFGREKGKNAGGDAEPDPGSKPVQERAGWF